MSECSQRSSDLIFEPEPENVGQVIDARHSNIIALGKQSLRGNLIPPDIDNLRIDFEKPVLLKVAKSPEMKISLIRRAEIITEMVDTFADHDHVLSTIAKHRSSRTSAYNEDQKSSLMNTAGMFNMLSRQETDDYFKQIDRGFELYQSGIDLNNLSLTNEKAVLELVAARQVVFLTNLRLVLAVSKPFKNPNIEDIDLIEEGIIGLSKAVDRFDRSKGNQFSTYAHEWISQGIMRAMSNYSRLIRLPVHMHEKYRRVTKQIDKLSTALGRDLTSEEALDLTGMTSDDITILMRQGEYSLTSLEAKLTQEDKNGGSIGDTHGALDPDMEKINDTIGDSQLLSKMITEANLNSRQIFVLGLRSEIDLSNYGDLSVRHADGTIVGYKQAQDELRSLPEVRLQDVADILGVSRGYIQTIEVSARKRLQSVAMQQEYMNIWKNID